MLLSRAISTSLLTGCSGLEPGVRPSYGYLPSLAAGIVFCILFSLAFLYHTFRSIQHRQWTSILLTLGATGELIGWAGRTWSSQCPYNLTAFLMQVTTLVIAPLFFAAALYIILGQLIHLRGVQYSLIRPRLYLAIFCTCDVVALLVQAAGAGIASHEFNEANGDPQRGTHIVVGGLGFQLASMTAFSVCFAYFLVRSRGARAVPRTETMVILATILSTVMIYVRCVYRTVQLAQGWTGYLSRHERFFIGLDAVLMEVAVGIFVFVDPAVLLEKEEHQETREPASVADNSTSRRKWFRRPEEQSKERHEASMSSPIEVQEVHMAEGSAGLSA